MAAAVRLRKTETKERKNNRRERKKKGKNGGVPGIMLGIWIDR